MNKLTSCLCVFTQFLCILGCYSAEFQTMFNVGDRIAFNCTAGTVLEPGSQGTITCNENGHMNGPVPKCVHLQTENSGQIAAQLSSWQIIKNVKWIMVMFVLSLGVLFSMIAIGFYCMFFKCSTAD